MTITLAPTVFSQLDAEAQVVYTPRATLVARYVEEHYARKESTADYEAEVEMLKKQHADYVRHHEREVNSLPTELTRLKAALDVETAGVARSKATSATHL